MATSDKEMDMIIEIICILIFPPLAVWYHSKACSAQVALCVMLWSFFVLPSIVHAIWFCFMRERMNSAA